MVADCQYDLRVAEGQEAGGGGQLTGRAIAGIASGATVEHRAAPLACLGALLVDDDMRVSRPDRSDGRHRRSS